MASDDLRDTEIIDAWHANAAPWTAAVRAGDIASRRLVTDGAIIDAVLSRTPRSVLDVGCGEGWLARALASHGVEVTGIDVVPALIEQARAAGGGRFSVASYEDLAAGRNHVMVDAVVCNFSLIGRPSVDGLFASVRSLLQPGGSFIVQTLHPWSACGDLDYAEGWRDGSWAGFGPDFAQPAPWYFRTLQSWLALFTASGLYVRELREPLHPATNKPASIIFIAEAAS